MNVQKDSSGLLVAPPLFFFSPVLSCHLEIELCSGFLSINNVLLALNQFFIFCRSNTMANFSIHTASWVYFEISLTALIHPALLCCSIARTSRPSPPFL